MSRSGRFDDNDSRDPPVSRRSWKRAATGAAAPVDAPVLPEERPGANPGERLGQLPADTHYDANAQGQQEDESFRARLRYLFMTTRQRDGSPWSFNAVARSSGGHISAQAVYRLYTMPDVNPSLETIRILAGVFGIDPEYFVRSDALRQAREQMEQDYARLEADPRITFVSRRMGQMSEADKALLVDFVKRLSTERRDRSPERSDEAMKHADDAEDTEIRRRLEPARMERGDEMRDLHQDIPHQR
ncbi:MAG TPA: hypothetical protein VE338_22285 [Ktedonobacterales bacterium]|jgi:transcriptional regulator with XRE-family HTH domain|nr:hypothetical protein [Ktedonobacterales bacterium]